eukprot:1947818-Amphidinium_carterae.1
MQVNPSKSVICELTTRDLGVDTQWAPWRNPVQKKRISTFHQSMNRVRALGLPAHVKARAAAPRKKCRTFVPALDVRLGRGLACVGPCLWSSWSMVAPLETLDADSNTVRVWTRRLLVGQVTRPADDNLWNNALIVGRDEGGWRSNRQWFSWDEAALKAKWASAQVLCTQVASTRRRGCRLVNCFL